MLWAAIFDFVLAAWLVWESVKRFRLEPLDFVALFYCISPGLLALLALGSGFAHLGVFG